MKPTYALWPNGGCPEAFDESRATAYSPGETVEQDGVVYECKPWPDSLHCSQAGYEPGTSLHWTQAWLVLGSCTGTREYY